MKRAVYCLWTGSNPMSEARRACLDQLRKEIGCELVLLDKDTIPSYEVPGHPFHPAYPYLSETHKADYLRTYLMHFYGGGYSDIKRTTGSWVPSFEAMDSKEVWVCGYGETGANCIATGPENRDLVHKWRDLVGNGGYICKPGTPLTTEWYTEMVSFLDRKLEALRVHPAAGPRDCAESSAYPIEWNEMLGRIFHRVCYKYKEHLLSTLPICEVHGYL